MSSRARRALLRVMLIIVVCVGGFVMFQHAARSLETHTAERIVRLVGGSKRSFVLDSTSIVVVPFNGQAFRAIVTPSCSSIASVLAIACLSTLAPPAPRRRRILAITAAIATVSLGNISRIAASVITGLFLGRSSLVLFHDWVGGIMTYVYTLGGFIVFLWILLPDRRRAAREAQKEAEQDAIEPEVLGAV
jgi:exosortase/archaeosortase family protein